MRAWCVPRKYVTCRDVPGTISCLRVNDVLYLLYFTSLHFFLFFVFPRTCKKNQQAAADAYDAILDEQLDLVGAALLIRRARCHFALRRWLQAAADAGRAAKVAAEADDDQVRSAGGQRCLFVLVYWRMVLERERERERVCTAQQIFCRNVSCRR